MENSPVLWARTGDIGASNTATASQSLDLPSIAMERSTSRLLRLTHFRTESGKPGLGALYPATVGANYGFLLHLN